MFNTSLTANSTSVSVTNAVLAAQQYGTVDVVSINQPFSLSLVIIDQISNIRLDNIQWGGFSWSASVLLYGFLQYSGNGSLSNVPASSIVVNTVAGTITANNLTINATGMYIIQVQLLSSNNVYNISLTSNAILVKVASSKWTDGRSILAIGKSSSSGSWRGYRFSHVLHHFHRWLWLIEKQRSTREDPSCDLQPLAEYERAYFQQPDLDQR